MLEVRARTAIAGLDVELAVESGCVALAGPSGAGKTTLLRIVAGLLRPQAGRVACGTTVWLDTAAAIDLAPERRRCALLFQDHALFGHLRAWQNVAFPLTGAERRSRAHELLDRFGLLERADARPAELSGGERQRVALARALALDPAVLLLDEPLAALDARTRTRAALELRGVLADSGVPCLLVTHDLGEAALLAGEVAILEAGRIVQRGAPDDLAARPATEFVAQLAGANVLSGRAEPGSGALTRVALDGGGSVFSPDAARGRVAVSVPPWAIQLAAAPGAAPIADGANTLAATIVAVSRAAGRVRFALECPQRLLADGNAESELAPGTSVVASWPIAATRLMPGVGVEPTSP